MAEGVGPGDGGANVDTVATPETAPQEVEKAPSYPSFVLNEADERRWDLCVANATRAMGEAHTHPAVAQMARWLYHSDLPTGDDPPDSAAQKAA